LGFFSTGRTRNPKLITRNSLSPDGGIGRRVRLKIWFSQESAGSIPVLGTSIAEAFGVGDPAAGALAKEAPKKPCKVSLQGFFLFRNFPGTLHFDMQFLNSKHWMFQPPDYFT
jgi:hypothetical protein